MPNIFITYRRDDSSATSELLHDRLAALFPRNRVFIDILDIPAGTNWQKLLSERLRKYDVVLAVVGTAWLSMLNERAANGATDFVRWEVAEALRQKKRIIPVLVDGAQLPDAHELPADVAELANLQSMPLKRDTRDRDIAAIAAQLEGTGLIESIRLSMQKLRIFRASAAVSVLVGATAFSFVWVNVFDLLGLDTRTSSFTMLIGDVLFEPALSKDLVLVGIVPNASETRSLARTRRADYARLIALAAQQKAKAIAFDITTEEPGPADATLIDAIRAARQSGTRVVFGFKALTPYGHAVALPGLGESGAFLGLTCIGQKLDNAVFGTVAMQAGKNVYGSFALYAVTGATNIERIPSSETILHASAGAEEQNIRFSLREVAEWPDKDCPARPAGAVLARIIFPLSHRERLRDPARRLNTDTLLAAASPAPAWQGKVIVVGAEHPLDLLQTRLDVAGPERYGFEFQAGAVNALMTGAIVTPLGFVQQWLLVLVMVAAAIAYRIWRVGKSRWLDVIVLPAACFAFLAITVLLYARLGLLVDSLYHLVAFGVTWWMLLALEKRWSHGRS
ncbi:CHASE2 domain protein [Caballeronia arationis]|jgi:CHASE2 domain-containing sensor protein|uniref:Sensor domain CHASE2-containing protein n=1 Tax=Caballeronia arationis TaxID=1777142 RepID=A0A7Z7N614_9BURK|nr:toll/interleukin-1 receptor domain-containing protein [Caballeronia arationis]SAK56805.1 CHASE2 domain protein [Caballeronia arationis]SOE88271.1 sensor domain CHASE2-containing protein [Caballeronia arationis]